ncbi:hypothetical protein V501_02370 [Pseudogymnoascus sp. VKM F-4519 (FW-2642)]|nr:hypothetical protein V501_02370 [Pseudogymnoascus sp. VKM F-4519 (FW-2642)]
MLVYYRQKIEREQLFEHYSVTDIIDSTNMTEEEIAFEYNALVDNIQEKMEIQYIPDRSPNLPYTQNQTKRNEERFEFLQVRRGLHGLRRVQTTQAQHQDYRSQVHRRSQLNTSTFDFISPEVNEEEEGLPPSQNQGDYLLPSLAKKPRKDNEKLLRKMLSGEDLGYGKHGYYLPSSGSIAWEDIYKAMAKALTQRNIIDDEKVEEADDAILEKMGEALGCSKEEVPVQLGGSCALQAEHSRDIGWTPQYAPEHILEAADAEVDFFLEYLRD